MSPGFPRRLRGGVQGTVNRRTREKEETWQLPISSRISYHTVISVLHNGLLPHGAHYAGLPRCARCGAVEAPDGLMPDASCLAKVTASFALGWEERSILRSCRFGFTPPEPYFVSSLLIEESLSDETFRTGNTSMSTKWLPEKPFHRHIPTF